MGASRHPARCFQRPGDGVVIRILFVVCPRIPSHNRIRLEQAYEKNKAPDHFVERDIPHAVIVIVQVEMASATEDPRHLGVVAFVAEHVLADSARRTQPTASPISSLVARTRYPVYPASISLATVPDAERGMSSECAWTASRTL